SRIRQVPLKEKIFLEYSRQQNIKEELYVFLLKTREETAIGKSSSLANAKVIDRAKSNRSPFKPVRSMVFFIAMLSGLAVPSLYIYLRDILNVRIQKRDDITNIISVPIVGEISHNNSEENVIAHKHTVV